MRHLVIDGGYELCGKIVVSGAKNASLPLVVASTLLTDKHSLSLLGVPAILDINIMTRVACSIGQNVFLDYSIFNGERTLVLSGASSPKAFISQELSSKIRAAFLFLGPLLAKYGRASVAMPGGCAIGARPVDIHIKALEQMGAIIELDGSIFNAHVDGKLKGADISMRAVSVGATEHIMMSAVLAEGKTIIRNAACEAEIVDLAECLIGMGAKIDGYGTDTVTIYGVDDLHSYIHKVIGDRIEAGSYMIAAAMSGGELLIDGLSLRHYGSEFITAVREAGVIVDEIGTDSVLVKLSTAGLRAVNITTSPYPGFSTDLQAQFMSMMAVAVGTSVINETIFEDRFKHVSGLLDFGMNIDIKDKHTAIIHGVDSASLRPAQVKATDLRGAMALATVAMIVNGTSVIEDISHMERGYEDLINKLSHCGARVSIIDQ